ncbi:MAG: metallophosphoesterase [Bacillota bacterium]
MTIISGVVIGALLFMSFGNNTIKISRYQVTLEGLPKSLDGLRIVHISDLHGKEFGPHNKRLARAIERQNPDLILVSGDMIDSRGDDGSAFIHLLDQLKGLDPVYCSLGNHEQIVKELTGTERYNDFTQRIREAGAILLDNERVAINREGAIIAIYGFSAMLYQYTGYDTTAWEGAALEAWFIEEKIGLPREEELTLLLAHNPKYLVQYGQWGADLILAGHVHGGVVRLPFVGGVFSPDMTLFPEYDAGLYSRGTAKMHVSRGLGNSVIPVRIFNRPDLSVITLRVDS